MQIYTLINTRNILYYYTFKIINERLQGDHLHFFTRRCNRNRRSLRVFVNIALVTNSTVDLIFLIMFQIVNRCCIGFFFNDPPPKVKGRDIWRSRGPWNRAISPNPHFREFVVEYVSNRESPVHGSTIRLEHHNRLVVI